MSDPVIHPKFHHFNLKTTRLQEMIDWYSIVVGAEVNFQDAVGAWLSNDQANHRIALLAFPDFTDDPEKESHTGLHHSAFEYGGFDELNSSYLRLKEAGIEPDFCLDHGMTFSYYYKDPDGNRVELQVDNFGDWAKSTEWMRTSEEFAANPIGQFVDPERVAADHADGHRRSRRSTPRRWPAATRPTRRRSRSRSRHEALQIRDRTGSRAAASSRAMRSSTARPAIATHSTRFALLAPVQPRKYLAIGLNYADHVAESGMEAPEFPIFFNKQVTCVVGPGDDVHMPRVSNLLDYEGELAIVIGTRCRHVPEDRAHEVIAGYTIANDVSVRDWQLRTPTMTMGKSFDTHGPLGPWIVTADELGDPHALADQDLGQRRAAPGRQHARDDLRLLPAGRPPLRGVHARARRRDRHRHAGRHRRGAPAVPGGAAEGRRHRPRRDRGHRRAREHGRRGAGGLRRRRREEAPAWVA